MLLLRAAARRLAPLPLQRLSPLTRAPARALSTSEEEEAADGVRWVHFGDPRTRNSLTTEVLEKLRSDLLAADAADTVRCVVIHSSGTVFSSGHNIKELNALPTEDCRLVFELCADVMQTIQAVRVPVIASVQGLATAAGCQLAATCDLVVAAESAQFQTPGVNIGLFCTSPGVALARALPRKQAMHMLLTGEPMPAQEAYQFGLVSTVVPDDHLERRTEEIARKVASASGPVLRLGKVAFNYQTAQTSLAAAYKDASDTMVHNVDQLEDAQEGFNAFLQKRRPRWKHR